MDGEQANPECPGCRELRKEIAQLRRIIEELRRAGKRQAGPFSKGPPKLKPKRPGRKPGDDYGTQFSRATTPSGTVNKYVKSYVIGSRETPIG